MELIPFIPILLWALILGGRLAYDFIVPSYVGTGMLPAWIWCQLAGDDHKERFRQVVQRKANPVTSKHLERLEIDAGIREAPPPPVTTCGVGHINWNDNAKEDERRWHHEGKCACTPYQVVLRSGRVAWQDGRAVSTRVGSVCSPLAGWRFELAQKAGRDYCEPFSVRHHTYYGPEPLRFSPIGHEGHKLCGVRVVGCTGCARAWAESVHREGYEKLKKAYLDAVRRGNEQDTTVTDLRDESEKLHKRYVGNYRVNGRYTTFREYEKAMRKVADAEEKRNETHREMKRLDQEMKAMLGSKA